jgi:flagellar FliL protein
MSESADGKKDAKKDAKAGGKSKLPLIIGLVVVLMAGGGGGYWWFVVKPAAAAAAEAAAAEEEAGADHADGAKKKKKKKAEGEEGGAVVKFEPFVVNLSDGGGTRFLRMGLSLVIAGDEAEAKHLEESKVALLRIRSQVLELLAQQSSEHVVTPEGKAELKEKIEEIATEILDPLEVLDVLFTEFVVQF